jgi:NADH dehydrogenase (ubiquinone) Fe-S protein 8
MLPASTTAASMAARQLVLARTPSASLLRTFAAAQAAAQQRGYATPAGPPPKGFRLKPPVEWDQEKEGTMTKVSKYFMMTEMARGMYLLLEQFFRPP